MDMTHIDVSKCERADKEVVEGFCLSFDMVKGLCLETMENCRAVQKNEEYQVVVTAHDQIILD